MDNYGKLPVFITATCSFGRWDMAEMQSAGEEVLLNPDGGGVALMTTVRLVYTSNDTTSLNPGLNRQINLNLFQRDEDGRPPRLGDCAPPHQKHRGRPANEQSQVQPLRRSHDADRFAGRPGGHPGP